MASTTFTMRLDEDEKTLISQFSKAQGSSMADFMLKATLDVIEDAVDLRTWHEAKEEFDVNPVSYSHDEVMQEFGLK